MTEYERGLILRVVDGFAPNLPIMFTLKQHYPACNKILEYLIKNKYTGPKLYMWIKHDLNNSPLAAWKYCLRKIENERSREVILGRDFV